MTILIKIILTGRLSTHSGFQKEDLGRIVNTFLMAGFSHVHKQEKLAMDVVIFKSNSAKYYPSYICNQSKDYRHRCRGGISAPGDPGSTDAG